MSPDVVARLRSLLAASDQEQARLGAPARMLACEALSMELWRQRRQLIAAAAAGLVRAERRPLARRRRGGRP